MMYFEDVLVYLFLTLVGILSFIGWRYARKHPETAMKIICMAALVAMALTAFAFAGAEPAEEELFDEIVTVDFKRVEPAIFNREAVLRIYFNYHGELLSWYDSVFLPQMEYRIIIYSGEEVIDAEPLLDAVTR
jgi:hypothetical protein